ncbi:Thiamine monophosphate synthase [Thermoplasmatales archaeon BRNA1]|nr:Thiamine monophosphate synthase [Thermoplasmatales archaeon BRNA1]
MKIIAITDRKLVDGPFMECVNKVAEAKPDAIILREKDVNVGVFKMLAHGAMDSCAKNRVTLVLNTFFNVAKELKVGKCQLPMDVLREYSKELKGLKVGASIHSLDELREAEQYGVDWVLFGNVFETSCKPGQPAAGLDLLKKVCEESKVPVYAVGGITPENARSCMEAGAAGVCARSSFMTCEDPKALVEEFRKALG